MRVCRKLEDWEGLLEHGKALLSMGEGGTALQAELGVVCLERLQRTSDGIELLELASNADEPDKRAAERLEQHFLSRGYYELAVQAIRSQAKAC